MYINHRNYFHVLHRIIPSVTLVTKVSSINPTSVFTGLVYIFSCKWPVKRTKIDTCCFQLFVYQQTCRCMHEDYLKIQIFISVKVSIFEIRFLTFGNLFGFYSNFWVLVSINRHFIVRSLINCVFWRNFIICIMICTCSYIR